MPDPLLGFALQSFVPPAQPCVVSDTTTLMTLASLNRSSRPTIQSSVRT